jgi:hypothetical protein
MKFFCRNQSSFELLRVKMKWRRIFSDTSEIKECKCASHPMNMPKQCAVIRFFPLNGLRPQHVHTELSDVHDERGFQLLPPEKLHSRFADRTQDLEDEPKSGQPKTIDLLDPMAKLPREKPFPSCQAICRRMNIPKTTCLRVLHEELGLSKFYSRWVPNTINANQMAERVTLSHQLLQVLRSDEE